MKTVVPHGEKVSKSLILPDTRWPMPHAASVEASALRKVKTLPPCLGARASWENIPTYFASVILAPSPYPLAQLSSTSFSGPRSYRPGHRADELPRRHSSTRESRVEVRAETFRWAFYRSSGAPPFTAPWRCNCLQASFNLFLVNPNPLLHRTTCPSNARGEYARRVPLQLSSRMMNGCDGSRCASSHHSISSRRLDERARGVLHSVCRFSTTNCSCVRANASHICSRSRYVAQDELITYTGWNSACS